MLLARDFRFALRNLRRSPGFTTVVVLILAIGIGANTAMFTLVNDILLKPLPSPEGHRIMHLGTTAPSGTAGSGAVSYPDLLDWRSQSQSFSALGLVQSATFSVSDGAAAAESVGAARMTANGFRILRIAPSLGRDFRPGEDQPGAPPAVILGHGLWMRRYGGDPGVIGTSIRVDEAPATVIGIMPQGMKFPMSAEMWIPLAPSPESLRRDARQFEAFGRLRDGVSLQAAQAEMELLGRRLEKDHPDSNRGVRPVITPYTQCVVRGEMRLVVAALQAAAALLLLVVCANAANLLLSRSLVRTREIAIRAALGASRGVLVRQLLTESLAYAALGGALGLVLAYWAVRGFDLAVSGTGKPYWLTFAMDYRVFGFLWLAVIFTGILFGSGPALQLMRSGVNDCLKEGGRGGGSGKSAHRLASAFVAGQLALTLVVLVGIGVLTRSIVNIYKRDSGFDSASVLTMRLRLPASRYGEEDERGRFQTAVLAALRRMPEVQSAAITSHLPMGGCSPAPAEPEGSPPPPDGKLPPVATLRVSPDYFRTFGIRLAAGRQFSDSDGAPGQAHAIVNQRFAAKYWRGRDPLGSRVRITRGDRSEWFTVIGVSADVRQNHDGARELAPVVYLPNRGAPAASFLVALRTAVPAESLSNAARKEIQALDAELPVSSVASMEEVKRLARWPHRVFGSVFAILGLVAAALAGLGVYSVMAYSVGMRTGEIGLRMALGATGADIRRMVILRGLRQAAVGLMVGVAGAAVVTRGIGALLVDVSATDPATLTAAAAFLTALALLACWLPARQAARIDPLEALRRR